MDALTLLFVVLVVCLTARSIHRRIFNPKCGPCGIRDSSPYLDRVMHQAADGTVFDRETAGQKCNGCHRRLTQFVSTVPHEPEKVTAVGVSYIQTAL